MSAEALIRFGELVIVDAELRHELLSTTDQDRFVALVVRRAREAGWDVDADDVQAGLRARRTTWWERWI
ncbi:MAG TPA: Nif11-like leader peptide family natural product precursor [Acidimicrobiales bacterium]|nr:Nif11-like leader peptide family natural product precursor [Acidimicrobiales bacterium]